MEKICQREILAKFTAPLLANSKEIQLMKVHDLVKIKDTDSDKRGRNTGIVLKLEWHHPDSSDVRMRIANVLWGDNPSWIDASRIELV